MHANADMNDECQMSIPLAQCMTSSLILMMLNHCHTRLPIWIGSAQDPVLCSILWIYVAYLPWQEDVQKEHLDNQKHLKICSPIYAI
jgi:hypothetical protein